MINIQETITNIFNKYRIETFLILASIITFIISLIMFLTTTIAPEQSPKVTNRTSINNYPPQLPLYVEIGGAVNRPDVYQIRKDSRLKDIIKTAGGLTDDADKDFFAQNFNLAQKLNDEEKYYIPTLVEVSSGRYSTSQKITTDATSENDSNNTNVNINSSQAKDLETLPGIGQVTAQKIIENRPYEKIDDLLHRKIVNSSTFEKIKDSVEI